MNANRQVKRMLARAASLLLGSFITAGPGTLIDPIAAYAADDPIPAYSAFSIAPNGCNGDNIGVESGVGAEARIDPEWAAIVSEPTILEGTVATPLQAHGPLGETAGDQAPSEVSEEDVPWTHYTHDKTFNVQPDPGYQHLLSSWTEIIGHANPVTFSHTEMEVEWDNGSNMVELHNSVHYSDRTRGAMPEFVWPSVGNRVWVEGQWIFDCGHPNPPSHLRPGCVEAPPGHCGAIQGCCDLPGCCVFFDSREVKYSSEIHPPRAVVTYRLNHPATTFLDSSTTLAPELPGGAALPVTGAQTLVPVTEADIFVSARGGGAVDHCSLVTRHLDAIDGLLSLGLTGFDACTHTGPIISVNDRNYVFDIYPPGTDYSTKTDGLFPVTVPTRDGTGTDVSLQWRVIDHSGDIPWDPRDSSHPLVPLDPTRVKLCPVDDTTPAPTQMETDCPDPPAALPTRLRVILRFAGTGANAFAESILLGWDDVPAPPAEPRVRTFQIRLHQFDVLHNGESFLHDGDWRVFVDVGGQWRYVSGVPFDRANDGSNICNGDSLTNNGDDDCFRFDGRPWTVSVLDGNPIHIAVGGFESDSVDDEFCTSPTGCDPSNDAGIALALANDDRIGTLDFDLDPARNYQAANLETNGVQRLGPLRFQTPEAGGENTDYRVAFTVQEVPAPVPPASTLSVGSPHYTGGLTFVTTATPLTLATTSTDTVGFQYRFHRDGSPLPTFSSSPFPVHWTATDFGSGPRSVAVFLNDFDGADGQYILQFSGQTVSGLTEPRHTARLALDNSPPIIAINQPTATPYAHSATLTLDYSVSDAGAGVQSFTPLMDSATTLADGTGLQSGQAIKLLTELTLGAHTFTINAIDKIGNAGSSSVTFTIVVTAESIKDDVRQFLGSGAIKNAGEANSLLAKLNAAAQARARGDCKAAGNIYRAFVAELQAQSGKGVDAAAATIMIADAQYLIAHCP